MSKLSKSGAPNTPCLPPLDSSFFDMDNKDDSTDFLEEPPCLCAQQIICTLFGAILGYAAILVSPAQLFVPAAIAQGVGITVGLFGSENSNIDALSLKDPLMILFVMILSAYIAITFVGAFNQGEVSLRAMVWTSFLLGNVGVWVRALTRYSEPEPSLSLLTRSTSSDGSTISISSPRRLKFKHSGDSTDWFEKNDNIMKV